MPDNRRKDPSCRDAERMRQLLSTGHRLLGVAQGLLGIAQKPERRASIEDVGDPGNGGSRHEQRAVRLGVVEGDTVSQMPLRWRKLALEEQRDASDMMRHHEERRVTLMLRQVSQLLPQLTRRLELGTYHVERPQAEQHARHLRALSHLSTEFPGAPIGLFHFWGHIAPGLHEGRGQGELQGEGVLAAFRRAWQGLEQGHPLAEMPQSFDMGGALDGTPASLLPVANSLLQQTGFGVVMRQQLGLGRGSVKKLLRQDLGNALVDMLPSTLEQRLIGGVLDQRVVENIAGLRWYTALIDDLDLHQPRQCLLQHRLVQ